MFWSIRGLYFGISSATGDLFDNHDVISLKVYEIEVESKDAASDDAELEVGVDKLEEKLEADAESDGEGGSEGGGGGYFKYFLALIVIGGIVGAVIYFRKEDNSKRFY